MQRLFFLFVTILLLCLLSYFIGYTKARHQMVEEHLQELKQKTAIIKNENNKRIQIWSQPHASSDELIGLFMQNKL